MIERGNKLHTNFYQMQINPTSTVCRYQFKYEPPMPQALVFSKWREIFKAAKLALQENLKVFISNNYVLYSPTRIAENLQLGNIEDEGNSHIIILEEKAVLKPGDPEYSGLIARFFKMMLKEQKLLQIGRKYFDTKNIKNFDQQGLKILPGVMCNMVQNEALGKYYINIDSSFKVLRTQTMYDVMKTCKDFQSLEGTIIMTIYNYKFYKINKITRDLNPTSEFAREKGEAMTYVNYYKDKYKVVIRDERQPLIEVIEKSKKNVVEKLIYLIPELCILTGLSDEMRNNFGTMKQLSTVTKPRGIDRVQQADRFINGFYQKDQIMQKWNIQLEKKCLEVNSSRVKPGNIVMGGTTAISIENGNLDRDTQTAMLRGVKLENWAIVYGERDARASEEFMNCLRESIEYCKFPCMPPKALKVGSNKIEDWISILKMIASNFKGAENVTLILLVLSGPKKNAPLYTDIKRFLINECPIASQVILSSTIGQPVGKLRTICNKLLVQICAKVGGTPWGVSELPFRDVPTMVCGMDVYHSTSRGKQSMLSFVSTEDEYFSKYNTQSVQLDIGNEFSFNLCPVLIKSIQSFASGDKPVIPQRIIVFRDGVSNSQAKVVIESEVSQFRQAIEMAKQQYKFEKKIELIVLSVNKKVGAKFYAGDRNFDNPPQGTLIDTDISNGKDDFYLISQRTTQGTVQPTHYHVLVNDASEDPNIMRKLQSLSYKLCYMYYNFSGAIKIPAPIQYAHVCSNFIGDRFDSNKPGSLIVPHQVLTNRRSLFFI